MVNLKSKLKGQALPLNTIVIAILVIIVLLVIIVFFTSKMGDSGDTLNDNNPTKCKMTNPAITALGYEDTDKVADGAECSSIGPGWSKISIVPKWTEDQEEMTCCGYKTPTE